MLKVLLMLFPLWAMAYPKSDHFDGEVFHNLHGNQHHPFWDLLKWKWTADTKPWPKHVANKNFPAAVLGENKAAITFINHATFLIQLPGLNILTDPLFSERSSPFQFAGPKRVREPGLKIEELPPIDLILVSHNHYDHLDLEALKLVDAKFHPLIIVPLGDEKLLKKAGIQNVLEMDWWQEYKIKDVTVTFAPSQHWSARGMFDKSKSLWGSYMVSTPNFKTYFAGDTGYSDHFKLIRQRLGAPDLALMPIGAYAPQWFMSYHHMNPEESLRGHVDLEAKSSVAMHFGTFQLTDEGIDEPVEELGKAKLKLDLMDSDFSVIEVGESKVF